jgi:hypothetical protein
MFFRIMAFIIQDDGICSKDDIVSDRCRGLAEKSDIRPAGSTEDAVFFPSGRSVTEQFFSLKAAAGRLQKGVNYSAAVEACFGTATLSANLP